MESITEIDTELGKPDYSKTEIILLSNGQPVEKALAEMEDRWWNIKGDQVIRKLSALLGAPFIPIDVESDVYQALGAPPPANRQTVTSISNAVETLRRRYFVAARERGNDDNAPQNLIGKMKTLIGDKANEQVYDYKAVLYRGVDDSIAAGYGSYHLGLTLEALARILSFQPNQLASKTILIIGMGTGDIAEYACLPVDKLCGMDISPGMQKLCELRGIPCIQGNIADPSSFLKSLPQDHQNPDVVIADYFLDVTGNPDRCLRTMTGMLSLGGKLLITILMPIDQCGADSKLVGGSNNLAVKRGSFDDIGNTGNPWSDLLRLKERCSRYRVILDRWAVTSYAQYDVGRPGAGVPLEIRPSALLAFHREG